MKKTSLLLLVTVLSISLPPTVHAQELPSPEQVIEEFLHLLRQKDVDGAYNTLFDGSQIPMLEPKAVDVLKKQTQMAFDYYGDMLGHEKIFTEQFGESILRYVYVMKTAQMPLVWEFYFYRPRSKWFLINVQFNDDFDLIELKAP